MPVALSRLVALALVLGAPVAGARADGVSGSGRGPTQAGECADLGSFAVVDPSSDSTSTLSAHSYTPCADLAGRRPGEGMHIGVEVMISGGQQPATSGQGTNPTVRAVPRRAP